MESVASASMVVVTAAILLPVTGSKPLNDAYTVLVTKLNSSGFT